MTSTRCEASPAGATVVTSIERPSTERPRLTQSEAALPDSRDDAAQPPNVPAKTNDPRAMKASARKQRLERRQGIEEMSAADHAGRESGFFPMAGNAACTGDEALRSVACVTLSPPASMRFA